MKVNRIETQETILQMKKDYMLQHGVEPNELELTEKEYNQLKDTLPMPAAECLTEGKLYGMIIKVVERTNVIVVEGLDENMKVVREEIPTGIMRVARIKVGNSIMAYDV